MKIRTATITAYDAQDGRAGSRQYKFELSQSLPHHKSLYTTTDPFRLALYVDRIFDELRRQGTILRRRYKGLNEREREWARTYENHLKRRRREALEKAEAMRKKA